MVGSKTGRDRKQPERDIGKKSGTEQANRRVVQSRRAPGDVTMVKDRDNEVSGSSQSKRPSLNHQDSTTSQSSLLLSQQQQNQTAPLQHQQPARVKSAKYIVGGVAGRVHARVPSSKALHKHHASASTSKLSRKLGSPPSPDRGTGFPPAPTHRRTTSDQKIQRDQSSTNLKKNTSHTNLKRNRSHVDVGKKSKSSTNLKRSLSNPVVNKVKSGAGASKVHFNLGDDGQDEYDDNEAAEDEWVDASASASPLLSRRGSTVTGVETYNSPMSTDEPQAPAAPQPQAQPQNRDQNGEQSPHNGVNGGTQNISKSLPRDRTSHNITSRILQRTPSHGAPPQMSTENVSVHPASSRPHSPDGGNSTLSSTPVLTSLVRPGSSGRDELTSRFVGNGSQDAKSSIPGSSFTLTRGGGTTLVTGKSAPTGTSHRPRSIFESVVQTQAQIHQEEQIKAQRRRRRRASLDAAQDATDDDEEHANHQGGEGKSRHWGPYGLVRDINRTQQKLNLQRASSTVETTHPHPGVGIGLDAVDKEGLLIGGANFDVAGDPRVGKLLERTGMEYLVVRRYQNPVARSLARVAQPAGPEKSRSIISRPGTAHSRTGSTATSIYNGLGGASSSISNSSRRPPTPKRAVSSLRRANTNPSVSSSLERDDATINGGAVGGGGGGPSSSSTSRMLHHQHNEVSAHALLERLSGASLVDGMEDAGTMSQLRNLWDKNSLDLSASQD